MVYLFIQRIQRFQGEYKCDDMRTQRSERNNIVQSKMLWRLPNLYQKYIIAARIYLQLVLSVYLQTVMEPHSIRIFIELSNIQRSIKQFNWMGLSS